MYDEIWCPQLGQLTCKKGNDRYKTDSDLTRFSMDNSELKEFLFDETLLQICSTDKEESKSIIVDECSTEKYES